MSTIINLAKQGIKYLINGVTSSITDLVIYSIIITALEMLSILSVATAIFVATSISRVISSVVHFSLNKKLFYGRSKEENIRFAIRYVIMAVIWMLLSSFSTFIIKDFLKINSIIAKMISDFCLGIGNFFVQRNFVFKGKYSGYSELIAEEQNIEDNDQ